MSDNASKPIFGVQHQALAQARVRRWSPGSLPGLLRIVGRRLWSHLWLMLAIAAGFVVAIALVVAIPVYAEAVGYRVLRDELTKIDSGGVRPPFVFMYRYLGSQHGVISWDKYAKLDAYMRDDVGRQLGLPVLRSVRYVASDKLPLLASSGAGSPLLWVNLAFASELDRHIEIVDGVFPKPSPNGPVEVLISEALASKLGFQVGEEYLVLGPKQDPAKMSVPVKIAGVWRARDPEDTYWFYTPNSLDEVMFIPEESYTGRVVTRNPNSIYVALWYLVTDGSGIRSASVDAVAGRIARTNTETGARLPGAQLDISPAQALGRHQATVRRLTVSLTVFSIPILGLIGYFIILVSSLVVQRQSNEIAVLRSRGASRLQVLGIYLLEGLLMGVVALGIGLLLAQVAALAMTWTRSFLTLAPAEILPIDLTPEAWQRGLQMLGLLLLASLLPALGAARYTVVSYKSERARDTKRPFWQRACIDLLLLIPVYYGYTQLKQRGTVAILGFGGGTADPFSNPLLLLTPTLYIFALALVVLRLFPLLMRGLAWVLGRLPGVSSITALRYLSRTPRAYTGPILLLVLTLSLASFTASMAATLDAHMLDRVFYDAGGDMRVVDFGQSTEPPLGPGGGAGPGGDAQKPKDSIDEAKYLFLPVSDYLTIPGVVGATRVARSSVEANVANRRIEVTFIGVDRIDFGQIAHWRDDYAGESLGALMNRLADDPSSLLVSSDFAAKQGLRVGDKVTLQMSDFGDARQVPFVVAGYLKLFPTTYPEEAPFMVGNLDYAFEQQGGQYPYEVWLRLRDRTPSKTVMAGAADLGLKVSPEAYAPDDISLEQNRPERQGLYGLLSVGFVAAAALTALGFLFYSLLSFQRRFVELGTLRAIGLSTGQLSALLGWEQALLIGIGMLGGTLIGVSASLLFIPFLQVRGGQHPQTPPFVVQIAWGQIGIIYLVFGVMLMGAILLTISLLRRMQLFQAIKLGEAV
ncbi:MAG TPA: FtsX-like permease family protein [Roseiflexaceae bacterium]|nr:FtsX-like permease family protein [Roseiflexaceae bacterium]